MPITCKLDLFAEYRWADLFDEAHVSTFAGQPTLVEYESNSISFGLRVNF